LTTVLSFEQDSLTADSSSQRLPECRLQLHPPMVIAALIAALNVNWLLPVT
jgi:hypothetical protein